MAKKRRKGKGFSTWGLVFIGLIIGVAAVLLFLNYRRMETPSRPVEPPALHLPPSDTRHDIPPVTPLSVTRPASPPAVPPTPSSWVVSPAALPRLAIVIDDMGQDLRKLDELFKVGAPITIAILPHLQYSEATATRAHSRGWEVILHLPMEPKGSDENDPGKGALWTAMTPAEVRGQLDGDIKAVPYAVGINNHMGSKFTEDAALMREVLAVAKKKKLFFLDSRTSAKSVASLIAREMGVASADRGVFLDNERDVASIKLRIIEAVRMARRHGSAIAIGHPYPETIRALQEVVPGLSGDEITVVRLSELVK